MSRESGQVLAFFAILLPILLLPLTAYAVDAAFVSTRAAALQEATAQAAEAAAQQLDVAAFRSSSAVSVHRPSAMAVAGQQLSLSAPEAAVQSVVVRGAEVTITTAEVVTLPFNFLPVATVRLEARASARLVGGYDSPSSRLPLPTSTF
jgi:Flp pilus assembly protein TadG